MKKFILTFISILSLSILLCSCGEKVNFKGAAADDLGWQDDVKIIVDLKGEVNMPGIYTFNKEVRLYEAVKCAGGFTKNAETSGLNLALMITEDQMIFIPKSSKAVNDNTENSTDKISLNRATLKELCTLPGVGEGRAQKIIDYRNSKPFNKLEDLMNVSGIGEELFKKIKPYICL